MNKYIVMEKFEFNSAICTSVEQSKRLLELGLKKETADMHHWESEGKIYTYVGQCSDVNGIPAWSLHRLIEMVADTPLQVGSQVGIHVEDTYDMVIQGIEWLISRGQFNKNYLEEKK